MKFMIIEQKIEKRLEYFKQTGTIRNYKLKFKKAKFEFFVNP